MIEDDVKAANEAIESGLKSRQRMISLWFSVLPPIKIIIVDDEPDFCNLIEEQIKMISPRKCDFTIAHTGGEAIAKVSQLQYDIMFLDLRMPQATGSGIDVLDAIDHKSTVVLIVTGLLPDAPEIVEARKRGHNLIIQKGDLFQDLTVIFGGGCVKMPECLKSKEP